MNDNFRDWITALRSGEYQQCQNRLAAVEPDGTFSFCCLGVAQHLMTGQDPAELTGRYVPDYPWPDYIGLTGDHILPQNPYVDIPTSIRDRDGYPYNAAAATLNDDWKLSFSQIADVLEYFGITSQEPR